jgi:guanylate kinase
MKHPSLKNAEDFKKVLQHYFVSEEAQKLLKDLHLVLLLAPSSTGRNTIIQQLVKTDRYYHLVADTTRPPRTNNGVPEENGREYWFKTEEEVLEGLKNKEYVEAELLHGQQVSGISLRELKKALTENKIAIKDVDIEGVHNLERVKNDAVIILLLPPNFAEWQRRLTGRSLMSNHELRRRMVTAERIFQDGLSQKYYQFVINDDINRAALAIDAIAQGKPNPQQGSGHGLIQGLQYELQQKLTDLRA